MKFNEGDLTAVIANLSMLRFFPPEEATRAAIQALLVRMCPGKEALLWLVDEFVNRIGEWRGPMELRAVLSTRWMPADGIEATSEIAGYTPVDGEAKSLECHTRIKAQERVGGWVDSDKPAEIAESSRRLIEGITREWPQRRKVA
jgi:hypothetical protein